MHSAVSPGRVLLRQAQRKLACFLADPGSAWPAGIRPLALDQPAVPGQHGAWRDEPMGAQYRRHPPGQRRQDRPVGPVQLRSRDLTPQHRDFVAEDHDLRILGTLAAAQQHQPAKDPDHEQIEEPERHRPAILPQPAHLAESQVTSPPSSSDAVHATSHTDLPGPGAGHAGLRRTRHVIPFRTPGLSDVLTPRRQGVFLRLYSSTAGASRTASLAFCSSESGGAKRASLRRYSSRRCLYLSSRCCPASVISRLAIRSPAPGRSRPAGSSTKKQTRIPRSRCTSRRTGAARHSAAVQAARQRRHPRGIPPPAPLGDPPWHRLRAGTGLSA